jgi:hypothetical protein
VGFERATAGERVDRVEEHIALVEAVAVFVAVDDEPLELRTGRAADEADFEAVGCEVAAGVVFDVDHADVGRLGREQLAGFDRLDAALARQQRVGTFAIAVRTTT